MTKPIIDHWAIETVFGQTVVTGIVDGRAVCCLLRWWEQDRVGVGRGGECYTEEVFRLGTINPRQVAP